MTWIFSLPYGVIAAFYLASYVALDWASYIYPLTPFGITPWNPSTGVSFALVLLLGTRFTPLLFLAPPLADVIVREHTLPLQFHFLSALAIGSIYGITLHVLARPRTRFDPSLSSLRSLNLFLFASGISTFLVAVAVSALLIVGGDLHWSDYGSAIARHWIGDMIGTCITCPLLTNLALSARSRLVTTHHLGWFVGVVVCVLIVFGTPQALKYDLFYILFIPVIWAAVHFGKEGVVLALATTQVGVVLASHVSGQSGTNVTSLQLFVLVTAVTGLTIGVAVNERQRAETGLRLHQGTLARILQVASLGQLAASIAHEVNQPLTAIKNYVHIVRDGLPQSQDDEITEAAEKATAQVERAAEIIRRLREVLRAGSLETRPVSVATIVAEASELVRPMVEASNIEFSTQTPRELPTVVADVLQIEQVLINLIVNAIEAIQGVDGGGRRIRVSSRYLPDDRKVELRVDDDGPGWERDADPELLSQPFVTTKADGTGLGLALSRSIVERHGGTLRLSSRPDGASVAFTLPIAEDTA